MATSSSWTNNCTDCGKPIEILNGDFEFSLDLHKQSHKSLQEVNEGFDPNQERLTSALTPNMKHFSDGKQESKIKTNDNEFYFQNDAFDSTSVLLDHSIASSGKQKRPRRRSKNKTTDFVPQPPTNTTLEDIFLTLPAGLKSHRDFISERSCDNAICNLCEISIEPLISVTEHLKTKLHEDNTLRAIKTLLPAELQDHMDFVSFYGSNLYCNLCEHKIDLCSKNLHETVVNIFSHNAGKSHSSCKSNKDQSSLANKPLIVLKTLALLDPLLSENMNLIEPKMNPFYKCKVCDKAITYSDNPKELLNNFKIHFSSSTHKKTFEATSVLIKWNQSKHAYSGIHTFVVNKQNIYCSACSCVIASNFERLLEHVQGNSEMTVVKKDSSKKKQAEDQRLSSNNKMIKAFENVDFIAQYSELFKPNTLISQHSKYLEKVDFGYKCKLCETLITFSNQLKVNWPKILKHFTGKEHETNKALKTRNRLQEGTNTSASVSFTERVGNELSETDGQVDFSMQYEELYETNVLIKQSARYLERIDYSSCKCKICDTVMNCDGLKQLEIDIQTHITGKKHKTKVLQESNANLDNVQVYNRTIQSNKMYLTKKDQNVFCSLCDCSMPSADNVDTTTNHIIKHLEGSRHTKNKKLREEPNTPTGTNLPDREERHDSISIQELFNKLPDRYQKDIEFISVSPIKGYLACRLCNSLINPNYLECHLEDLQHVQGKDQAIGPNILLGSQQANDQSSSQRRSTLSNLLQKIDLKSPWKK